MMNDWCETTLGQEIELAYGKSLPAHMRESGRFGVFGSNGLVGTHIKACVEGPGIIVGRKGSVGEIAYSSDPFWPIDTTYYVINKGGHNWRFLYHLLCHSNLTSMNSHSAVPGLNREDAYSITLKLPQRNEQNNIANVLDCMEHSMHLEAGALNHAQELRSAAMSSMFTLGLRGEAQKETEIGQAPESWEVASLSEVATLARGRFMHRPRNEPRFYGGKMPFIQTGDVVRSAGRIREYTQTLNEEGVAISRVFRAGIILITIAANIGYSGILEFDAACPDSLVAISPSEKLNNQYLNYYLQTQQPRMDREAPKGTQKNINIQFLSPWPVLVPPIKEQHEIVAILDALERKIAVHQQRHAVLEQLFKLLLHKLMIGEIRVSELDLSVLPVSSVHASETTA